MSVYEEQKQAFLNEVAKLHERHELADTVSEDYYEPGMMEFLEQYEGIYNEEDGTVLLQFEAAGTRYEGRTERIESVHIGDALHILRDKDNVYNSNNFTIVTDDERNVGNFPAVLCNAAAPLYDNGDLIFEHAEVSYVEPVSVRSRYAKKAVLFVRLVGKIVQ